MLRDRGRIKWTAMMLPEHVKLLRGWAEEDHWETKIELDEQKLTELDETLRIAKQLKQKVAIQYYAENRYQTVIGTVHSFHPIEKRFNLLVKKGKEI